MLNKLEHINTRFMRKQNCKSVKLKYNDGDKTLSLQNN